MSAIAKRREGIFWTTMEWNLICKAIDKAYPQRAYKNAKTVSEVPLALGEINKIVEEALLPSRQRIIKDSYKFKKGLIAHLNHKDPAKLRKDPVIWGEDEWKKLAIALIKLQPEKHLLFRESMDCLVSADIEAAMLQMPEDRRRSMHLGFMREKLASVFKEARAKDDPAFMGKAPPPVEAVPVEAVPVEAAPVEAAPVEAPPEAPTPAPRKSMSEIAKLPKVYWKLPEWIQVAEEMIRLSPRREAAFLRSDLDSVTARDVKDAQLVLPEDRRRNHALNDVASVRKHLTPAFEYIAKERRAAEQRANDDRARAARIEAVQPDLPMETPAPPPAPEVAAAPALEPAPAPAPAPAPEPAPAPAPEVLPAVVAANPWEAMFKPMMAELTTQFANAFAPMVNAAMTQGLQQAIMQGMQQIPAMIPQPPPPPPSATPDAASQAAINQFKADNPVTTQPDNRPHVAVIGPIPQLGQELINGYPQLRLTVLDSEAALRRRDAFANAERVIGMTKFLSHKCADHLAKLDSYTPVNGGLSSVRYQLDIWIKAGHLPTERRKEARA